MFRQGDVLIQKVQFIPKSAVKQPTCILALGEATGHAHQIKEGATLLIDTDGAKYVDVFAPPFSGHLRAELLDEDDRSFLVRSQLGTIRFSKQTASFRAGVVNSEPFALLEHEEHHFHALNKGHHFIRQQREYTPQEIRNVKD